MAKIDKAQILRKIRNIAISVIVLLVVVVGAGVAYTWYVGQDEAANLATIPAPVAPAPSPVIKPVKPAADAKQSAAIQMLTSPVPPGDNASIIVKTNAESHCTITVEYDTVPSTDSGLKPKKADDFGVVSWTWTVDATAPLGEWPVEVRCGPEGTAEPVMVRGQLIVEREK